jgi:hypothetical protein
MLSLIAGHDHISALISLPPQVPQYFQGQEKTRHVATVPIGLPFFGPDL